MIEPGPTGSYGSDGIAREGMETAYAAALWRDNPAAFWLHPEGPLADSAPEEFFKPAPPVDHMLAQLAGMGLSRYGIAAQQSHHGYLGAAMSQYQHAMQSGSYADFLNRANACRNAPLGIKLFG